MMNVVLAVTFCCFFVIFTVPTDAGKTGRIHNNPLKAAIGSVTYKNGLNNDILNPQVSLMEAWGLYKTILSVFNNPTQFGTATFAKRKFDLSQKTWIVVALDGGNGINGVLGGILNHLYGGQTIIIAGRQQNDQELKEVEEAMNDANAYQRKVDLLNLFNDLLASASNLGIEVIRPTLDDADDLWDNFNKTFPDVKCTVLLESMFGKGYDGEGFRPHALPLFEFIRRGSQKGWKIWGTDGSSGVRLSIYIGRQDTKIDTSIPLIPKCDYATLFYGLSGLETVFMKTLTPENIFLATNSNVVTVVAAQPDTYNMEHKVYEVVYDEALDQLQNTFYTNISELDKVLSIMKHATPY